MVLGEYVEVRDLMGITRHLSGDARAAGAKRSVAREQIMTLSTTLVAGPHRAD
jgi:hypothetical protein